MIDVKFCSITNKQKNYSHVLKLLLYIGLLIIALDGPALGDEIDCLMCHSDLSEKKVVHPALQMGCTTCHSAIDASDIPHKKTNKIAKGLSSEPPELCFNCHDKSNFEGKVTHPPVMSGMCTSCHNPHSTDTDKLLMSEPPTLCFMCHDETEFQGKSTHPPVAGGMCMSCHFPHKSDNEKLLQKPVPDLCFSCHEEKNFQGKFTHSPVAGGMCMSCHFPHKSDNEKLLQAPVPEVCFNCHDNAAFSKKNIHPPVAGGMCIFCHNPHASAYPSQLVLKINDVCGKCHIEKDLTTGIHVIRGFGTSAHPVKGKKDPKRADKEFACSSCHNPHSSDYIKLFRYKAESLFELCQHCHEK